MTVRLQQDLHRAEHLPVLLGTVEDSCCGCEVGNELGGGYLLLFGAAFLRHFDGFTKDEEDREAGEGGEREVAGAQLGVVDLLPTAVLHKIISSMLMLREWPYTASSRDVLGNISLGPRGMYFPPLSSVWIQYIPPLDSVRIQYSTVRRVLQSIVQLYIHNVLPQQRLSEWSQPQPMGEPHSSAPAYSVWQFGIYFGLVYKTLRSLLYRGEC